MKYRLLLDLEVVEFIERLPRSEQISLRRRLGKIQDSPAQFADYEDRESDGRTLSVHVCFGFAIYYWDDFADRHVKIFRIRRADR